MVQSVQVLGGWLAPRGLQAPEERPLARAPDSGWQWRCGCPWPCHLACAKRGLGGASCPQASLAGQGPYRRAQ
eukprot:3910474-Lingulodinium_polyedra.AAC.1